MTVKILKIRIENLEFEKNNLEFERSNMLGGSLLSEALDRRISDLKKQIENLTTQKEDLRWSEIFAKNKIINEHF